MTPTEEVNKWISEFGSARDALNVALARLSAAYLSGQRAGREQAAAFVDTLYDTRDEYDTRNTILFIAAKIRRLPDLPPTDAVLATETTNPAGREKETR